MNNTTTPRPIREPNMLRDSGCLILFIPLVGVINGIVLTITYVL